MARSDSFQKKWASVPSQFERPADALIDRGWAGGAAEDPPEAKWENWWHNRVDEALAEIEANGALSWFEDVSYGVGAAARNGGQNYIAAIASTGIEPGSASDVGHWQALSQLIATQMEAEGGIENTKRMTALRSFQLISKYGLGASALPLLTTVNDSTVASGLYRVESTAVGLPIAEPGFVDVRREGAGLVSQRYFSRSSSRVFFRRASGSFGTWEEFIHTGNLGTSAEMATGTSTIKPPSIAAVMSLFAKRTFAADDFIRIPDVPGGLIIQWGRLPNVTADGVQDVTFPVAFPSVCRGMLGCLQSPVSSNNPVAVYAASTSLSAAKVVRDVTTTPYATGEIFWVAFGD